MIMELQKKTVLFLVVLLVCISLSACSGGGGTDSSPSTDNTTDTGSASLTGVASKGLLNGATITVYALDDSGNQGEVIGTATTDATGAYSVSIGSYTGNILVVATGGAYVDEATGSNTPNTATLRAAVTGVSGSVSVAVTPFTEIAVQLAGTLAQSSIDQANTIVSNILGGTDIITTMPADVLSSSSASGSTDSKNYGLALAAVSQMVANGSASSVADAITGITTDLSDSQLNTTGADLLASLAEFIDSAYNQTGVAGSTRAATAISQYTDSAVPSTHTSVAAYSASDLAGSWHMREFGTQQNGYPDSFSYKVAAIAAQADGWLTMTPTACLNKNCSAETWQASIASDGTVSNVLPPAAGEYGYGAMNAGKDVMVFNSGDTNSNDIDLIVKKASSYSTSDLAGTWQLRQFMTQHDGLADNFTYTASTAVIQSDGSFTETPIACNSGCLPYSTILSITADGVVSDTSMGPNEYGYFTMSAGKDVIIGINGNTPAAAQPSNQIIVLVKQAASYSMADLAGTWYLRQLTTQQNGGADSFAYESRTVVVQADGSYTSTPDACNNNCSAFSGAVTISSDGTVSHLMLAPGDYAYIAMSAGKDVMVGVGGDASVNEFFVLVKKAD